MNLQLVPKYKKFNKTLSQAFFVSVPASFRERPGSYAHDLPVPIKIDPYKQKKRRGQVHIGKAVVYSEPNQRQSKISKILLIKKKRRESFDDSEKGCCGFKRWCAKKKALNEFKAEKKRRAKQADDWHKWKYQEAARKDRAEREKARLEREAEYVRQVHEIEKQERKLAKNTLKTRYPTPTVPRKPSKDSFRNNLSTAPYYPKRIEYNADDDIEVVRSKKAQKRERKKTEKKRKTSDYVPFDDTPPECKCSKFKQYMNKIKKGDKDKKSTPYTDPYKNLYDKPVEKKRKEEITDLYDKPYESTKQKEKTNSHTNAYHTYERHENPVKTYDEPTNSKRKPDNLSKESAADLYKRYYELSDTNKKANIKEKKTETKKQKIKKTDLEKRKSCDFSQKFVNCFYRTCCECFCWLSIFLIIGFAIIMVV